MKQIICKSLSIGYDKNSIQNHIDISIDQKDFITIVGNNGSGKSTFMKTILGLMPSLSGEIIFASGIKNYDIGYLPQQTQRQKDFPASVWEVALSGHISRHALRPFYTRSEKLETLELLDKIGIMHLKNKSYSKLSTGQQQRTLLARTLCSKKKIIFLDEPTSALDPLSTAEMYTLFKELNKDALTIVMITHDIENSLEYANKVLLFDKDVKCMDKEIYLKEYCSCLVHTNTANEVNNARIN